MSADPPDRDSHDRKAARAEETRLAMEDRAASARLRAADASRRAEGSTNPSTRAMLSRAAALHERAVSRHGVAAMMAAEHRDHEREAAERERDGEAAAEPG
jgi:hypothetical protein